MAEGNGNVNGKSSGQLQLIISAGTIILAVISAFIWIGSLASQVRESSNEIDTLKAQLNTIYSDERKTDVQLAEINVKSQEIETQFRAMDQLNDVRIAEDLRWRCQFFEKLYSANCPTVAYFPQMTK